MVYTKGRYGIQSLCKEGGKERSLVCENTLLIHGHEVEIFNTGKHVYGLLRCMTVCMVSCMEKIDETSIDVHALCPSGVYVCVCMVV